MRIPSKAMLRRESRNIILSFSAMGTIRSLAADVVVVVMRFRIGLEGTKISQKNKFLY